MDKEVTLVAIEAWAETKLPAQYRHFLLSHEESIFGESVLIYPAEYLAERNENFETKIYCPGYIAVGDDSGGRAFVISLTQEPVSVYVVGQGYMSPDGFELVANDFSEWVKNGCPIAET